VQLVAIPTTTPCGRAPIVLFDLGNRTSSSLTAVTYRTITSLEL
jgi:hypothetical protein